MPEQTARLTDEHLHRILHDPYMCTNELHRQMAEELVERRAKDYETHCAHLTLARVADELGCTRDGLDLWVAKNVVADRDQARTRIAELEAQQRRHEIALGQAWDDGNATGLDGWTGPGRGAGEVDDEAERARQRAIEAGLGGPVGDPEVAWQDWADDLTEVSTRDAFRAGWHAAHGTLTQEGQADA